ncbi:unannotated protein [freshwater metagenome]|uniref:Unannotated protein n=1 Tax=freshwater metagenome TaxID=449393 RepID=A0A6J7F7Y0_9ZZZZ
MPPGNDATHVCVDHGLVRAIGKDRHGSGSVGTDARQLLELGDVAGNPTVELLNNCCRAVVQPERAPRITEVSPRAHSVAGCRRSKVGRCRPTLHPASIGLDDACGGSLLQHKFADQHTPSGDVGTAPGEVSALLVEPRAHQFRGVIRSHGASLSHRTCNNRRRARYLVRRSRHLVD